MPISARIRSEPMWIDSSSSAEIASVGRYGIRGWDHGRCCGAALRAWPSRPPRAPARSPSPAAVSMSVMRRRSSPIRSNQVVLSWV